MQLANSTVQEMIQFSSKNKYQGGKKGCDTLVLSNAAAISHLTTEPWNVAGLNWDMF